MAQDSSSTVQPHAGEDVEGVVTKRGAWPDARGRIFLEIDGRVIILADECAATVGDRVTCRGLTRVGWKCRVEQREATIGFDIPLSCGLFLLSRARTRLFKSRARQRSARTDILNENIQTTGAGEESNDTT